MDSLAKRLCEKINDEIVIIDKLRENSLSLKDITVRRDLKAFEQNNVSKRAILMMIVSLQRQKDSLINELASSLGLHKDSSVKTIIDSGKLDTDSLHRLTDSSNKLEIKIKELDTVNSLVSTILLTSFKFNKAAIDIFRVHGTVDSTYSKDVKVNAVGRRSQINRKV